MSRTVGPASYRGKHVAVIDSPNQSSLISPEALAAALLSKKQHVNTPSTSPSNTISQQSSSQDKMSDFRSKSQELLHRVLNRRATSQRKGSGSPIASSESSPAESPTFLTPSGSQTGFSDPAPEEVGHHHHHHRHHTMSPDRQASLGTRSSNSSYNSLLSLELAEVDTEEGTVTADVLPDRLGSAQSRWDEGKSESPISVLTQRYSDDLSVQLEHEREEQSVSALQNPNASSRLLSLPKTSIQTVIRQLSSVDVGSFAQCCRQSLAIAIEHRTWASDVRQVFESMVACDDGTVDELLLLQYGLAEDLQQMADTSQMTGVLCRDGSQLASMDIRTGAAAVAVSVAETMSVSFPFRRDEWGNNTVERGSRFGRVACISSTSFIKISGRAIRLSLPCGRFNVSWRLARVRDDLVRSESSSSGKSATDSLPAPIVQKQGSSGEWNDGCLRSRIAARVIQGGEGREGEDIGAGNEPVANVEVEQMATELTLTKSEIPQAPGWCMMQFACLEVSSQHLAGVTQSLVVDVELDVELLPGGKGEESVSRGATAASIAGWVGKIYVDCLMVQQSLSC
eukprot:TRINITY_DN1961_c0_g1_i2.p1 TRINITY_DN1961_c0_g1~~TRINITY_DN1961_c0_g1_i2.p1  ORF type:complete len:568 (-),score=83.22 TRINITY_DN1961_c0_g1_i2:39-1742(-)